MSNGNNTSAHIAARKLKASDIEKEYAQSVNYKLIDGDPGQIERWRRMVKNRQRKGFTTKK